jgi:hypothetical protein
MGIRDKPIAPASPLQNGFAEQLIGSIRRKCLDHIIVLGGTHLHRILKSYARYYNETRTHLALETDCITNMSGVGFRQAPEDAAIEDHVLAATKRPPPF